MSSFKEGEEDILRRMLHEIDSILNNYDAVVPIGRIEKLKERMLNMESDIDNEIILR